MGRIKTDNRHLGILSGYEGRWQRLPTGTTTIRGRNGEPVVLHTVFIGTTSGSAIIIRDSVDGVITTLKANIAEGVYSINVGLKTGHNLIIENPGGSDVTVRFSND